MLSSPLRLDSLLWMALLALSMVLKLHGAVPVGLHHMLGDASSEVSNAPSDGSEHAHAHDVEMDAQADFAQAHAEGHSTADHAHDSPLPPGAVAACGTPAVAWSASYRYAVATATPPGLERPPRHLLA
jgi:hypothetical protein